MLAPGCHNSSKLSKIFTDREGETYRPCIHRFPSPMVTVTGSLANPKLGARNLFSWVHGTQTWACSMASPAGLRVEQVGREPARDGSASRSRVSHSTGSLGSFQEMNCNRSDLYLFFLSVSTLGLQALRKVDLITCYYNSNIIISKHVYKEEKCVSSCIHGEKEVWPDAVRSEIVPWLGSGKS